MSAKIGLDMMKLHADVAEVTIMALAHLLFRSEEMIVAKSVGENPPMNPLL